MENLKLRRSARKDSERIENLVKEYNFKLVPPADGFCDEEEMICKKISDNDGNMIAGCVGYISPWGCLYVDDLWVDERYRRQELGSHLLQAAEEIAVNRGCYLSYLGTGDFQAKPFYLKHGYALYGTVLNEPVGHESFELFKRLEKGQPKRHCRPIPYQVSDGTEEDMELIGDKLYEYNLPFLAPKHDYIKINRKLVDESGKAVAAIMAGVTESDVGVVWKIWVDEEYRDQGLGTRLINHFEKKAKENGATKIIVEELYDWNVGFFISICKKATDENGKLIAGIVGGVDGWDNPEIDALWVDESCRRQGIGSALLRAFEQEAKEKGAYRLAIEPFDWNVGFFRKNGYETVTGVLEDYPKGHTMYCMEKPL